MSRRGGGPARGWSWPTSPFGPQAHQPLWASSPPAPWAMHACSPAPHGPRSLRAVLCVHAEQYEVAQRHIDSARVQLDSEFTALVGESYHRAYRVVVRVEQLADVREQVRSLALGQGPGGPSAMHPTEKAMLATSIVGAHVSGGCLGPKLPWVCA